METNTIPAPDNDPDLSPLLDDGLNHRQREFADHYLSGNFAKQAAILAGYSADNASRIATRLLRTPAIAAYIADERQRLAVESFYSRRLLVDWLWKVIHTSPDDVQEGDNIIQELTIRELANGDRIRRVKLVNKMAALRQLARMHGYDKPELGLPGNLANTFKPFQVVNDLGQAPRPPVPSPLPGKDRFASVPPAKILRIVPSGPADAVPPTSNAQGPPQSRSSPGRDRSPSGPAEAAHPTSNAQGSENLPSSRRRRPEPGPLLAPVCCQSTQPQPPKVPIPAALHGKDQFASVPPAKILRIVPSGPADAVPPTSNAQGPPQSRSSPGRDRSPSGPAEAAHPTSNAQGSENLPSSRRRRPEPGPLLAPVCCQSTLPQPPKVPIPAALHGKDRFASVPPAKILRIVPSGPADATHPTLPDQAPPQRPSSPVGDQFAPAPPPEILQPVPGIPSKPAHPTPHTKAPASSHSSPPPLQPDNASPIPLPSTISPETPPSSPTAPCNQSPSHARPDNTFTDLHDGPPPIKTPSFRSPASGSSYSLFSP